MLEYLQARDPSLVRQPFFARFDPQATWFDQLEPLTSADARFWPGSRRSIDTTAIRLRVEPLDRAERNWTTPDDL